MDQEVTSQFDRMQNTGAYLRPGIVKGNIRCSHILYREMEPFHPMIKHGLPQGGDLTVKSITKSLSHIPPIVDGPFFPGQRVIPI